MPAALQIEYWPISRLKPYANNARRHSAEQVAQIAASIEQFGFNNPILVDSGNGIVAGHGRYEAAVRLKRDEVPVIVLGHLTDRERRAYIIADNKLAENSTWDDALLAAELAALNAEDFDLGFLGFSDRELETLLASGEDDGRADACPDLPDAATTVSGDLWLLGRHRVLCGDATNADDVARLMAGAKADMVFTDPPYGMNLKPEYRYNGGFERRCASYQPVIGDDRAFDPAVVLEPFIYCKEVYLWGADYYCQDLPRSGSWIVWDKTGGNDSLLNAGFASNFELCWSKTSHKRDIARVTYKGVAGMKKDDGLRVHPTQKPVGIAEWFFGRWGNAGDLAADLFLGSGSTLIACEKTKRICYGMELSPEYCDVIVTRWQEYTGKQATLDADGRTFAEVRAARCPAAAPLVHST